MHINLSNKQPSALDGTAIACFQKKNPKRTAFLRLIIFSDRAKGTKEKLCTIWYVLSFILLSNWGQAHAIKSWIHIVYMIQRPKNIT